MWRPCPHSGPGSHGFFTHSGSPCMGATCRAPTPYVATMPAFGLRSHGFSTHSGSPWMQTAAPRRGATCGAHARIRGQVPTVFPPIWVLHAWARHAAPLRPMRRPCPHSGYAPTVFPPIRVLHGCKRRHLVGATHVAPMPAFGARFPRFFHAFGFSMHGRDMPRPYTPCGGIRGRTNKSTGEII